MKRILGLGLPAICLLFALIFDAKAQSGQETYTGTVISYGSGFNTRTVTGSFTLTINRRTSDQQARNFLATLQEGGQDSLLRSIRNEDLGFFSVGAQVGRRLNAVVENNVDGRRRIFAIFERWTRFAELRGGYRSVDYPFGVIEISVDPQTGKGEGTYIAAARIRFDNDRNGQSQVEIENFATYPARLLGIRQRNRNNR